MMDTLHLDPTEDTSGLAVSIGPGVCFSMNMHSCRQLSNILSVLRIDLYDCNTLPRNRPISSTTIIANYIYIKSNFS